MIQTELAADLQLKWDRMQQAMQQTGADGCLLTVDVNIYYTTGRIYSGYFYLPAEGTPWFFVKRPNGLAGDQVIYIRKPEQLPELFAENGLKMPRKLLLEGDEVTYNEYTRLLNVFQPEETGNATALLRRMRCIKTPWEIDQFRISAKTRGNVCTNTLLLSSGYDRCGISVRNQKSNAQKRLHRTVSCLRSQHGYIHGSILAGDNAECPSPFDFALGGVKE